MASVMSESDDNSKKGTATPQSGRREKTDLVSRDRVTMNTALTAVFSLATGIRKSPCTYFREFIEEGEEVGLIKPGAVDFDELGLPVWKLEAAEFGSPMFMDTPEAQRTARGLVEAAGQASASDDGQLIVHSSGTTKVSDKFGTIVKAPKTESKAAVTRAGTTEATEKASKLVAGEDADFVKAPKSRKRKRESGEHAMAPAKKKVKVNEKGRMADTLSSHAPMSAYLRRELRKAIAEVKLTAQAASFVQPFAVLFPEAADTYAEVVQRPSDLGTMEQKLASGQYKTIGEFRKELDLIPVNAAISVGANRPTAIHGALVVRDVYSKMREIAAVDPDAYI